MSFIRAINSRLYIITKAGGKQISTPLSEAEADLRQRAAAITASLPALEKRCQLITRQLRDALLEGEDTAEIRAERRAAEFELEAAKGEIARLETEADALLEAALRHHAAVRVAEANRTLAATLGQFDHEDLRRHAH